MNKLLSFTKEERVAVAIILLAILAASFANFKIALRKSRDSQRKSDVRAISDALNKYNDDFGFFPAGLDILDDLIDPGYPPYLKTLPEDPEKDRQISYYYLANARRYQIYASLEGTNEDEYDSKIEKRGLPCGVRICNFGLAFGQTPLDKSIEEYENELLEK